MSTQEQEVKPEATTAIMKPGDDALEMGFSNGAAFALLQRVATMFSQSSLVPQAFQGNVPNCVIALNMAARLRADPLMVMQNLYIVYNRPAWSAQFLIATLNQNGGFSKLRYEWQGEKGQPDWGCRAWALDKATNEKLYGTWITWKLANDEGWVSKNGSKWKTMPEQMFVYRAGAWFVKAYAPELSMGLPTNEELEDAGALELVETEPGIYGKAPEPEAPEPGQVNGDKAADLTEALKSRRKAREATPEDKTPGPEAQKPAAEAQREPGEEEDEGDDKIAEQRKELESLFAKVKEKHGEQAAKERLEILSGFRSPARVKEEKLSQAIDGMRVLLEAPAQR